MTEPYIPERPVNRRATAAGLDIVPVPWSEGFSAAVKGAFADSGIMALLESTDRAQYYDRVQSDEFGVTQTIPAVPSTILSPAAANEKYGIPQRLTFEADTPEPVARSIWEAKRLEIERQTTRERSSLGFGGQLTAGLVASVMDPVGVALAFVPVVGQARYAAMVAKMGVPWARAAKGAIEGAAGAAMLEPLILSNAMEKQADYTAVDSLLNLAFGTAMGSGLHLGAGYLGDRLAARANASALQRTIDDLPRADQEALLRTATAQVLEGRPVDVAPVLDASTTRPSAADDPVAAAQVDTLAPELRAYAADVVESSGVKDVYLVGSVAARGAGRDVDLLYDLGVRELPDDPVAAAARIEELIETETRLDTERVDSFFKVGDRYFHLSRGAGRAVIENTEYAAQQAGKPKVRLNADPGPRPGTDPTPDVLRRAQDNARLPSIEETGAQANARVDIEAPVKTPEEQISDIEAEITEREALVPEEQREALTEANDEIKAAAVEEKALRLAVTCRLRRG